MCKQFPCNFKKAYEWVNNGNLIGMGTIFMITLLARGMLMMFIPKLMLFFTNNTRPSFLTT